MLRIGQKNKSLKLQICFSIPILQLYELKLSILRKIWLKTENWRNSFLTSMAAAAAA